MPPFASVQILVNEKIYLRDPEQTELGRKIVSKGIELIDDIGFEAFTFKKLAQEISSTEASIYRYFENKHKLLSYFTAWYWGWLEYQVDYQTHNLDDPEKKLRLCIQVLAGSSETPHQFQHIDISRLGNIVMNEAAKAYLTKWVDNDNKKGYFLGFKSLCGKIAANISQINPSFKYPRALTSTIIEAAHQQRFFSLHLPRLTEIVKSEKDQNGQIEDFLWYLINFITHPEAQVDNGRQAPSA